MRDKISLLSKSATLVIKMHFFTALKHCMLSLEGANRRRERVQFLCCITSSTTHLYCIVSDVVEALSLVIRILTMLNRKTKFI